MIDMIKGNKVKHEDGLITEEPWHRWEFKTKAGTSVTACYTDKEISQMKLLYPEIKFSD